MKPILFISAMMLGGVVCAQVPVNDECEGAINLYCGQTVEVNMLNATSDGLSYPNVWFKMAGTGELITFSACESTDSSFLFYVGKTLSDCDSIIGYFHKRYRACDTDSFPEANEMFESRLSVASELGTTYYVEVKNNNTADTSVAIVLAVTCEPLVIGCTLSGACNYNPEANWNDGSCDYVNCGGCGADSNMVEVRSPEPIEVMDANGNFFNFSYSIFNDSDSLVAFQYDPVFCGTFMNYPDTFCGTYQLVDNNMGYNYVSVLFCLPVGCYTIDFELGSWEVSAPWWVHTAGSDTVATGVATSVGEFCVDYVYGCMQPDALNYNVYAQQQGDIPCIYPGDFNGDGNIDILDLLDFFNQFGCMEDCPDYDLNGDGFVNLFDLLEFWLLYGG